MSSTWVTVVVTASVAITLLVVAWFVAAPRHPEAAASHSDQRPDTPSERFYGRHPPGPAGPDAESQCANDTGNAFRRD